MTISVIIPVFDRAADLERCLAALAQSTLQPVEVIVVDDGSTDESSDVARRAGVRVVRLNSGPLGLAVARNRGAEAATGDILVFVDSDVLVYPESLGQMADCFAAEPRLSGVFGSYDANPPERGLISLYKNLFHHYVHQNSRPDTCTFWAGCGALSRAAFVGYGGFDESYKQPSIEDIELGTRLTHDGLLVWSRPQIRCTHLKRWTFGGWIRTDIFCRALPWSRLIRATGDLPNDLNLGWSSRVAAIAAWVLLLSLCCSFIWPWAGLAGLGAILTIFACNFGLFRFFHRTEGVWFTSGALGLHTLYLLYSSLTFLLVFGLGSLFASREWARLGTDTAFDKPQSLAVEVD